jgi:hypothetical protein
MSKSLHFAFESLYKFYRWSPREGHVRKVNFKDKEEHSKMEKNDVVTH